MINNIFVDSHALRDTMYDEREDIVALARARKMTYVSRDRSGTMKTVERGRSADELSVGDLQYYN